MRANEINTFGGKGFPNGIATGIDWEAADIDTEGGRKDLVAAVNSYFKDLRGIKVPGGEKTTRTGHISGLPSAPDIDVRFYGPSQDAGVLQLFRFVDKTASSNPTYQMANVSAKAIVFEQKREGQAARIRQVSGGTPVTVSSVTWHGALGIDDEARRFDDYGVFEQNVQQVPNIWNDKMVDNHVALLTALGAGVNEAWSTDLITTVNNGCAQILEDVGDTYGLPDRPVFGLLYNHRRWNMVQQALASNFVLPNDTNSVRMLQFDIVAIPTRKIDTTSMYLALPGFDMVTVEWDGLFSEFGRDFSRGVDAFVWRARQNAAIGNVSQLRRITPP